jgi:N-acetylneuraminate synthase
MSYITYRERLELGEADYEAIDQECRLLGLPWFASAWDESSVEFLMRSGVPALKVASAGVTDTPLLRMIATTGKPVVMSTGGSTLEQIDRAVEILGTDRLVLLHCRSTYPAQVEELNLRAIDTLLDRYGVPVGFSDHAPGLWMSLCAVARGAAMIERHVTVDRSSFGSDQAASVEFHGLARLIKQIRNYERALGDGVVRPYQGEEAIMRRLRRRHA